MMGNSRKLRIGAALVAIAWACGLAAATSGEDAASGGPKAQAEGGGWFQTTSGEEAMGRLSRAEAEYSRALAAGDTAAMAAGANGLDSAVNSILKDNPDSPEMAARCAVALAIRDVNTPIRPIRILIPFLLAPRSNSAMVAMWFLLDRKRADCAGRDALEQDSDGEWCVLFKPGRRLDAGLVPALFYAADNIDMTALKGWELEYRDGIEACRKQSMAAGIGDGLKLDCMKEMVLKAVQYFPRQKNPLTELLEREEARDKAAEQAEMERRHDGGAQDPNGAQARLGRVLDKLTSREAPVPMTPKGLDENWRRLARYRHLLKDNPHLPNLEKVRKFRGEKAAAVFDLWYRLYIQHDVQAVHDEIVGMPGWREEPCLIYMMAKASDALADRSGKPTKERFAEYIGYLREILKLTPGDEHIKFYLTEIEGQMNKME